MSEGKKIKVNGNWRSRTRATSCKEMQTINFKTNIQQCTDTACSYGCKKKDKLYGESGLFIAFFMTTLKRKLLQAVYLASL